MENISYWYLHEQWTVDLSENCHISVNIYHIYYFGLKSSDIVLKILQSASQDKL